MVADEGPWGGGVVGVVVGVVGAVVVGVRVVSLKWYC